jgi:hypothetical protein
VDRFTRRARLPIMPTPEEFRSSYKGTNKERYNKAIRAEIPGGDELLDLLQLVHQVRTRGRVQNPLDFLETIEDRIQDIRDEMVESLKAKYHIGPAKD